MPVSLVVGGQYGSEGKGKVANWLAREQKARFSIRVGGANSGHTVIVDGKAVVLRHLPTSAVDGDCVSVIPSGAYLDLDVLSREISELQIRHSELLIHPDAVVIESWMKAAESCSKDLAEIASTNQGVGMAVAHRTLRRANLRFARDEPSLKRFVRPDVSAVLHRALTNDERVLIEGTQGFGLSLLHSGQYPYCTSRDVSAAGALSEAGLSPINVDCVVMVIRAFPIRVAGKSGPLPRELTWDQLAAKAGTGQLLERTTVTKRIRRIAEFDNDVVAHALRVNQPNVLVLNHVDYFDYSIHEQHTISASALSNVEKIESTIGRKIDYLGTGPSAICRRASSDFRLSSVA